MMDLTKMTCPQLKNCCVLLGDTTFGKKSKLIEKITKHDEWNNLLKNKINTTQNYLVSCSHFDSIKVIWHTYYINEDIFIPDNGLSTMTNRKLKDGHAYMYKKCDNCYEPSSLTMYPNAFLNVNLDRYMK